MRSTLASCSLRIAVLAASLAGCAGTLPVIARSPSRTADPEVLRELVALGGIAEPRSLDPAREVERLLRVAELSGVLGNLDEQADALSAALAVARAHEATTRGTAEHEGALARLRRVRRATAALAATAHVSVLWLAAEGDSARDVDDEVLRRTARVSPLGWLAHDTYERLDATGRARAELLGTAPHGARVPDDALDARDIDARELLERRMRLAADTETARRLARRLADHDRWHVPASAALLLSRADGAARTAAFDGFASSEARWQERLAELLLATHESPGSSELALALAVHCLDVLPGDALQIALALTGEGHDGDVRRLARAIVALVELGGGVRTSWDALRASHDDVARSPWVARAILETVPRRLDALRDVRALALASTAERGELDPQQAREVVLSPGLDAAARARAFEWLTRAGAWDADVAAGCLADALDVAACDERVEAVELLSDGEWSEAMAAIDPRDLDATAVDAIAWAAPDEELEAADALLARAGETRHAASAALVRASVTIALRRGDHARALAILDERGALLPVGQRVRLRLYALDERDGATGEDDDAAWDWAGSFDVLDADWAVGSEPREEAAAERPHDERRRARLGRAAIALAHGDVASGSEALRALAGELEGAEAAHLLAWSAALCDPASEPACADALARAEAADPASVTLAAARLRGWDAVRSLGMVAALRSESLVLAARERGADVREAAALAWAVSRGADASRLSRAMERGYVRTLDQLVALDGNLGWWSSLDAEVTRELGAPGFFPSPFFRTDGEVARVLETARAQLPHALAALDRGELRVAPVLLRAALLGDTDAAARALAAPRPEGAATDRDPVPVDDVARLVVDARLAIDDALALRLLGTDDVSVAMLVQLDAVIERPGVRRLACALSSSVDDPAGLVARCGPLWRAGRDPIAAMRLSWLAATGHADVVLRAGIDAREVLTALVESSVTDARMVGLRNASVQALTAGEVEEAAWLALRAEADGWISESTTTDEAEEVRHRGPSIRAILAGDDPAHTAAVRSLWSLSDGSVDAAVAYANRAVALASSSPWIESGSRDLAFTARDVAGMVRRDVDDGRLAREDVASIDAIRRGDFEDLAAADAEVEAHPSSRFARWMRVSVLLTARGAEAIAPALALFEEEPLPSLAVTLHLMLGLLGRGDEARATLARAREAYPDDPRLALDARATSATAAGEGEPVAAEEPLPAELASPEAWQAAARTQRVFGSVVASAGGGVEIVAPPGVEFEDEPMLRAHVGGAGIAVISAPRDSECVGESCLDRMVPDGQLGAFQRVWSAPADLGGPELGHRILLRQGPQVLLVTVIPSGARLLGLLLVGHAGAVVELAHAHGIVESSLRATDVVRPTAEAFALLPAAQRASVYGVDRAALERTLREASGAACPEGAGATLARPARAEPLLLDVYLGLADVEARRRALVCGQALGAAAGRLGVAALADPDASARALAVELVTRAPEGALAAVRSLLSAEGTGASRVALGGIARGDTQLPPLGPIDTLVALPQAQRAILGAELFASPDARQRALAVVLEAMAPGTLASEAIHAAIRERPPLDALRALDALPWSRALPADYDAMRARVDALRAPLDADHRWLARALAYQLVRALDARDAERLERLAALQAEGITEREDLASAEWSARWIREELALHRAALGADAAVPAHLRDDVDRLRATRDARRRDRIAPEVVRRLATEPLPRFLPRGAWTYVRIPQPGLFIETLVAMHGRLEGAGASEAALARAALAWLAEQNGGELLGPDGGLDLTRPLECARAEIHPGGWVCAAYARDPERVRTVLARRRYGTNSGVAIPLDAAPTALHLPMLAGALPFMLREALREPEREHEAPTVSQGGVVLTGRARSRVMIGGVPMERFGTFLEREHGTLALDTEHYVFTGERVLMFGLESTARVVLGDPPAERASLAGDATFRMLTEDWAEGGAAMQLVRIGYRHRDRSLPFPIDDLAVELVADARGVIARMRARASDARGRVDDLEARLPADAASVVALVDHAHEAPERALDERDAHLSGLGALSAIVGRARRAAFAWTPHEGDGGSEHWVAAVQGDATLDELLAARGLAGADGELVCREGLCATRASGIVVAGTEERAVREAAARRAAADAPPRMGAGRFDGPRAARAFAEAARGLPARDPRRASLTWMAAMLSVAGESSFEARRERDGRLLSIDAHLAPRLAEDGGTSLVVAALASDRNAIRLPRTVSTSERRGLRLVVRTDDPSGVAEAAFGGQERVSTSVLDGSRLEVLVRAEPTARALTEVERARLLGPEARIPVAAPAVRERAAELASGAPDTAATVERIVTWVHSNVRYELTSAELDAATVLERLRGDCSELSRTTVALLRAAGIPAEVREGFAVDGREMVAHAWVAWHDGTRFHEVDPTSGALDVDAAHVPASVWGMISLLSIGAIEVTELGAAPAAP